MKDKPNIQTALIALQLLGIRTALGAVQVRQVLEAYLAACADGEAALWRKAAALYVLVHGLRLPLKGAAALGKLPVGRVRAMIAAFELAPEPGARPEGLQFAHYLAAAGSKAPRAWLQRASKEHLSPAALRREITAADRAAAGNGTTKKALRREIAAMLAGREGITAPRLSAIARRHGVSYASALGCLGAAARDGYATRLAELEGENAQLREQLANTLHWHREAEAALRVRANAAEEQCATLQADLAACRGQRAALQERFDRILALVQGVPAAI